MASSRDAPSGWSASSEDLQQCVRCSASAEASPVCVHQRSLFPVFFFLFVCFVFLRETTNLENRILHGRGGCRRNCGGENWSISADLRSRLQQHFRAPKNWGGVGTGGGEGGGVHLYRGRKNGKMIHVIEEEKK